LMRGIISTTVPLEESGSKISKPINFPLVGRQGRTISPGYSSWFEEDPKPIGAEWSSKEEVHGLYNSNE